MVPERVPVEITVGRQADSSSEKHWWIIHREREREGGGDGGRDTERGGRGGLGCKDVEGERAKAGRKLWKDGGTVNTTGRGRRRVRNCRLRERERMFADGWKEKWKPQHVFPPVPSHCWISASVWLDPLGHKSPVYTSITAAIQTVSDGVQNHPWNEVSAQRAKVTQTPTSSIHTLHNSDISLFIYSGFFI